MKKLNIKLRQVLVFALVLYLVTPLLAFAKSGNSLNILVDNSEAAIDYWKIDDESLIDYNSEDYEKKAEELVNNFSNVDEADLNKKFGEKKTVKVSDKKDGKDLIKVENLSYGTYLFRQVKTEEKTFKPFIVSIDETTINPATIIPKTVVHDIILRKIDKDTKDTLMGVGFKLVDKEGNTLKFKNTDDGYIYDKDGEIEELITNDKGQIKVKGLEKEAKFIETSPLNGYEKNKGKETSFLKDGETVDFENEKDSRTNIFTFVKIDGDTKNPLEGAVFKVQVKTDKIFEDVEENGKIYTLTSGKDGIFKTKQLPYGTYRLIETKTPTKDYILKIDPIDFEIGENSHQMKIEVENYKGKVPPTPGGGSRQRKKTSSLVKTGDVKILIIFITGLILIAYGIKTVRAKD
ncbi:peptidase [Anaerococcus sp. AGMB00486]|uniref:Peptidase n=1 Tax=Anaerococcus faecalis TaxID=2742993 RepID=A0ABX2N910_9FIRM|nr:SpaA isopeptide-forming pilin-related protein [Anaerococcus faecalis]NVF11164.1 peptidase [Anaerococcus faecalis]